MQLPIVAHESINNKIKAVWSILCDNNVFNAPINYRGFNLTVEFENESPVKIRGQLEQKLFSIGIDYTHNEINIKHTNFADKTLVFSNKLTETSHVNQRGKVKVTEWCITPVHRTKRQIPRDAMKEAETFLNLIIDNLNSFFKRNIAA